MCGIAGFAGRGDRSELVAMTRALAHRGPDGEGFHVDHEARVFLGHRRLAILDLDGGAQPMWNEDGTVCVVYNGEIYNHMELRQALVQRGHRFATDHSDTEILVHGYEEWGGGLAERLNGMFAFAIYDASRGRLLLGRDRFGEKPLYYAARPGFFGFASELSALALHPDVGTTLDPRALQKYFAYGYLPAPNAILEGTRKLPAGHLLTYDLASAALDVRAYWRFRLEPDEALTEADEARLTDELEAVLDEAVRRRLISDVPLGVFLSGGLDSSSVVAAASNSLPADRIQTFTIGFTEPSFDESEAARTVAGHIGTHHREQVLSIDEARDLIPTVLDRLDEPLGDASILPTFMLSRFVRQHVTVALSGDGGDELFAGYDPFLALRSASIYDRCVPGWMHKGFRRLADLLPRSDRNMSLDFKIRRTLMGLSYPEGVWLPVWMSALEPSDMAELFETPLPTEDLYSEALEAWESADSRNIVDRAMEFFTQFYLQDDILTKVDRAAMMNSLESRAVFLDNDLVDFCRRLPNRFKFRNGERKYLLKKVAARRLPKDIVERRKKGFGIPLAKWLRTVPEKPPSEPIRGTRPGFAQSAWDDHRAGRRDNRLFLWSWLSLQHTASRLASRPVKAVSA